MNERRPDTPTRLAYAELKAQLKEQIDSTESQLLQLKATLLELEQQAERLEQVGQSSQNNGD